MKIQIVAFKKRKKKTMSYFRSLVWLLLLVLNFGCNSGDEVGSSANCRPISVFLSGDSLAYGYNSNRQLISISRFFGKSKLSSIEEYTYTNGKVTSGKISSLNASPPVVTFEWSLEYGTDGLPSKLSEKTISAFITRHVTHYQHDSKGRLQRADTQTVIEGLAAPVFYSGYSYVYNDADNVTTVRYIVRDNSLPGFATKDVLARENLTFDDASQLFQQSESLRTINVYLYKQIPSKNNVLSSKIYYNSYTSSFKEAEDISFSITYNSDGKPSTKTSTNPLALPYFGDLLFSKATYSCD